MRRAPAWLARTWEYTGAIGTLVALFGGVVLTVYVFSFFATLEDAFAVSEDAVAAGTATIEVLDDALVIVDDLVDGARVLVDEGEQSLQDVAFATGSVVRLMNEDLPAQINTLLVAMDGLIETANVVDGILGALALVGVDYDPEVPLDEGLQGVEESLAGLPPLLEEEAERLFIVASSLVDLGATIGDFDATLVRLGIEIGRTQDVVVQYQDTAAGATTVIAAAVDDLGGQRAVALASIIVASLLASVLCSRLWWVGRVERLG